MCASLGGCVCGSGGCVCGSCRFVSFRVATATSEISSRPWSPGATDHFFTYLTRDRSFRRRRGNVGNGAAADDGRLGRLPEAVRPLRPFRETQGDKKKITKTRVRKLIMASSDQPRTEIQAWQQEPIVHTQGKDSRQRPGRRLGHRDRRR